MPLSTIRCRALAWALAGLPFVPALHAADGEAAAIAGTYDIRICKGACLSNADPGVYAHGLLILFAKPLEHADAERLDPFYYPNAIRQQPNGCFVLERLKGREQVVSYVSTVGLTGWQVYGDGVRFALYRSPDAGYEVTVQPNANGLSGTGVSWGAGVAAPVGATPDKVVAQRIGDADLSRCAVHRLAGAG